MKLNTFVLGASLAVFGLSSCSPSESKESEATITTPDSTQTQEVEEEIIEQVSYAIDTANSVVTWVGSKVYEDESHNGLISISSGSAVVAGDQLVGGEIVIDMNSITDLDIEDEKKNQYLISHLKGSQEGKEDHFFNVAKYPTAKFVITAVNDTALVGDLTIRDQTHSYVVPSTISVTNEEVKVEGELIFDREQFGANYGTASALDFNLETASDKLKDQVISNDIKIGLNIIAKK